MAGRQRRLRRRRPAAQAGRGPPRWLVSFPQVLIPFLSFPLGQHWAYPSRRNAASAAPWHFRRAPLRAPPSHRWPLPCPVADGALASAITSVGDHCLCVVTVRQCGGEEVARGKGRRREGVIDGRQAGEMTTTTTTGAPDRSGFREHTTLKC